MTAETIQNMDSYNPITYPAASVATVASQMITPRVWAYGLDALELASSDKIALSLQNKHALDFKKVAGGVKLESSQVDDNIALDPNGVGTIELMADTNVTGNLGVTEGLTVQDLVVNDTATVGGVSTLNSVVVTTTMDVGGASTLSSTLDVAGIATMGSNLVVQGPASMNQTLNVLGAASMSDTLAVTGASTMNSTLDVVGAVTMDNTLAVTGASTMNSTLAVSGAATMSDTLAVTGASTMNSTLAVSGAATMSDTLVVTGASTMNSTLAVSGAATMSDTLAVSGAAPMSGDTIMNANATVAGYMAATGEIQQGTADTQLLRIRNNGTDGFHDFETTATNGMRIKSDLRIIGDIDVQGNVNSISTNETVLNVEDKQIHLAHNPDGEVPLDEFNASGAGIVVDGKHLTGDMVTKSISWNYGTAGTADLGGEVTVNSESYWDVTGGHLRVSHDGKAYAMRINSNGELELVKFGPLDVDGTVVAVFGVAM
jgi:hypothetical protein